MWPLKWLRVCASDLFWLQQGN